MRKILSLTLISLILVGCSNQEPSYSPMTERCKEILPWGYPLRSHQDRSFICRKNYAFKNNNQTKFVDWVAYKVSQQNTFNSEQLQTDPDLNPEETLELKDYQDASQELGVELVNLAPYNKYLSTVVPMTNRLSKLWEGLTDHEMELAKNDEIYVISGTAYLEFSDFPNLPKSNKSHQIPTGFWKIIIIPSTDTVNAYIFPQEIPEGANYHHGVTSLTDIEEIAGLNLFFLRENFTIKTLEEIIPVE
jgi:endonuclease G, mitochondrial